MFTVILTVDIKGTLRGLFVEDRHQDLANAG